MPRDNLEAWSGQKCKIFWPDDVEWYDAVVRLFDRKTGKHNVWYYYDHQVSLSRAVFPFDIEDLIYSMQSADMHVWSVVLCAA